MRTLCIAVLSSILISSAALGDIVITTESKDLRSDPPRVDTQRISMTADKVHTRGAQMQGQVIYRGDRGLFWVLDDASKSYMELDKAAVAQIGEQMNAAMKQMQDALSKMSDEERKMAEQFMKGKMPAASQAPKTAYKVEKTAAKQTIQGHTCTRWDLLENGVKSSEIWAASWSDMGIPKDSFKALESMSDFFAKMMESNPALMQGMAGEATALRGLQEIDGCPVLVRSFEGGKATEEVLFKSVESQKIDAAVFEVPAGYTKKQLTGE